MAWSPDGQRLAAGSSDRTAKVWDVATGKELLTLGGHSSIVDSAAWSPDGQRLATAGDDGTLRVYPTEIRHLHGDSNVQVYAFDIGYLMNLARQRVTANPSDESCKKYLHVDKCPPFPALPWW